MRWLDGSGVGKVKSSSASYAGSDGDTFVFAFLVERWFLRLWSRCPWIIAADCGGFFLRVADGRPGKWWTQFLSSAFWRVETEGDHKEAWANSTKSAGVADAWLVAMLAWLGCSIVAANAACAVGCLLAAASCEAGCGSGSIGTAVVGTVPVVVGVLAMHALLVVASAGEVVD